MYTSLPLPNLKLILKMPLELLKLIPKLPSTSPTLKPPLQILFLFRIPPRIILRQRKILKRHQKRRREGIIVLPMPERLRVHVAREDVHVEMSHAGNGVYAAHYLGGPVSARRERAWGFWFSAVQHPLTSCVARAFGT